MLLKFLKNQFLTDEDFSQTVESPLYSLNLLAAILGILIFIALFGTWRQLRLYHIAEAIAQEKSLLNIQAQAQVELLTNLNIQRQAIKDLLRQQTQDLENTLRE